MKHRSRANALLVELVLVIFFFVLGSSVLVQLFSDAKHKSRQAKASNDSLIYAQNVAEELYGAEDPEDWLGRNGFSRADGGWTYEGDGYSLFVTENSEDMEGGVLRVFTISSRGDGKDLFSLPSARYLPKEVSP